MRATHLVYEAAGRPAVPAKYRQRVGRCAVCGGVGRYDMSDLLGDSFTNWTSCTDPTSQSACSACLFCLKEPALKVGGFAASRTGIAFYESPAQTKARGASPQSRSSAILGEEWIADRLRPRAAFWEVLASPPAAPFVLALNTAGGMPIPRHMPVVSRVGGGAPFPVTYCLDVVAWDPVVWVPAHAAGARALADGLWVGELATGKYRNRVLVSHRALVREVERLLVPLRQRSGFALLLDMLPRLKRDDQPPTST